MKNAVKWMSTAWTSTVDPVENFSRQIDFETNDHWKQFRPEQRIFFFYNLVQIISETRNWFLITDWNLKVVP